MHTFDMLKTKCQKPHILLLQNYRIAGIYYKDLVLHRVHSGIYSKNLVSHWINLLLSLSIYMVTGWSTTKFDVLKAKNHCMTFVQYGVFTENKTVTRGREIDIINIALIILSRDFEFNLINKSSSIYLFCPLFFLSILDYMLSLYKK